MRHVLLVESHFYDSLSDHLFQGARTFLEQQGVSYERLIVPGALEIPGAVSFAYAPGRYDAFVALGVVIRGETPHFEIVAFESARALMQLTMQGVALGNGILTCDTKAQALTRADPMQGNKGKKAAQAALKMVEVKEMFRV